jgi:phage gp46-like protein
VNNYWQIDPSTGDYVMVNGRPVLTDSIEIPAYYRIRASRGKWMYAPDNQWGSDLNTLQKQQGTLSLKMIETACQPMIDDGRAISVDAEYNTEITLARGNSAVNVNLIEAGGEQQTLELPPLDQ